MKLFRLWLLLALASATSFLAFFYPDHKESTHANSYERYLEQKEADFWERFAHEGIPYEDIQCFKHEILDDYLAGVEEYLKKTADNKPISSELNTLIHDIMVDYAIDPQHVTIVSYTGPSEAAAHLKSLFVNQRLLATHAKTAQKFIVAHELQHILNEDPLIRSALKRKAEIINKESLNKLLEEYFFFQEQRADIQAALKNLYYATAYQLVMQETIKTEGEGDSGDTHPFNTERLALAQNIIALHENKEINGAQITSA